MNELKNYEERSPSEMESRRSGFVATAVYAVVMIIALAFTQCNVSSPDEELNNSANVLLISFGDSELGSEMIARQEVQQIAPPRPITPEITESEQLTDEQSEVEIDKPVELEKKPETIERERPQEGESIPQIETPQINQRALFPGSSTKQNETRGEDTAVQGVVGNEQGSTEEYSPLGDGLTANFSLSGRSLVGRLPVPTYGSNAEGRVVISIVVDDLGRVTSASMRTNGTTTTNSTLIEAARKAALKARFTPSDEFVQSGTITYIFKLN